MAATPLLTPRAAHAPTLGLIGGGQLAKMLAQSALQFGCEIVLLERAAGTPAAQLARTTLLGDWDDPARLLELGARVEVTTLENEFVDAGALAAMEAAGHAVWPRAATMRVVQDKLLQKEALAAAGLPLPRFRAVGEPAEVNRVAAEFGWPLVLKKRRNGYDGKGNATVRSPAEVPAAWAQLGGGRDTLYVEEFCPFAAELAIMIVRGRTGETVAYPLVETTQHNHICHVVEAPANVPSALAERAAGIARRAVAAVEMVGAMGVEMFLTKAGEVLVNELAPRVHNSGHYTIEACVCSQFENHVRAVLGWPLGSPALLAPAAVMINLLGAAAGPGTPHGLAAALAVPGAHPHIYGKAQSQPGRKMGHLTALGQDMTEARATARRAADHIRFGDPITPTS